jgi:site-specific DNA recombinase
MSEMSSAGMPEARVAIYARFSSDLQRDASIEDQIRTCRARADRESWHITEIFSDYAISGATTLRPGYQSLLAALRLGTIDIVLAESLDRFSRDLEHIASLYKQCVFHEVQIHTVSDGDISELHIGLKGTMGALYLKDLAEKTKRGLEGRIHAGRCTGTPPYGYSVVRKIRHDGELDRGLRSIDPERAVTVKRIFEAYAAGSSPRQIAVRLNAQGVRGPNGGIWYDSTILGRPKRGDGILRNELYIGRLIWRRRVSAKDPVSGARLRRYAKPETYITKDMPDLRIVEDDLWRRVQQRLKLEAAPSRPERQDNLGAFWDRRRPRHFLSGKVECGVCGRAFKITGQDYLACRLAKHGSCHNTHTIRRRVLERHVLELLSRQLMQPDLLAEFMAAYHEEYHRLANEMKAQASTRQRERAALDRKISNLVDAIGDGRSSPAILAKLSELEAQRARTGNDSASAVPQAPALCPSSAQPYAAKIQELREALLRGDEPEALEAARRLIDKVTIYPPTDDDDPPRIELVGDLMALLQAAGVASGGPEVEGDPVLASFVSSVKEGPGAEPLALLPYSPAPPEPSGHAAEAGVGDEAVDEDLARGGRVRHLEAFGEDIDAGGQALLVHRAQAVRPDVLGQHQPVQHPGHAGQFQVVVRGWFAGHHRSDRPRAIVVRRQPGPHDGNRHALRHIRLFLQHLRVSDDALAVEVEAIIREVHQLHILLRDSGAHQVEHRRVVEPDHRIHFVTRQHGVAQGHRHGAAREAVRIDAVLVQQGGQDATTGVGRRNRQRMARQLAEAVDAFRLDADHARGEPVVQWHDQFRRCRRVAGHEGDQRAGIGAAEIIRPARHALHRIGRPGGPVHLRVQPGVAEESLVHAIEERRRAAIDMKIRREPDRIQLSLGFGPGHAGCQCQAGSKHTPSAQMHGPSPFPLRVSRAGLATSVPARRIASTMFT